MSYARWFGSSIALPVWLLVLSMAASSEAQPSPADTAPAAPTAEASSSPAGSTAPYHSLRGSTPGESVCSQRQTADALVRARAALVYVTAPNGSGLGFALHSDRFVATAFSIVRAGRAVEVSRGAERRHVTIAAVDEELDLALLELESPMKGLVPLVAADQDVPVGAAVLAIGRVIHDHEIAISITPGVVTTRVENGFHTSSLVSFHATYAGPLLDCRGRVVGMAANAYGDDVVSAQSLRRLFGTMEQQPPYEGSWSAVHPSLGAVVQIAPGEHWLGLNAGTSLIGYDQWQIPFRLGLSGLVGPSDDDPDHRNEGMRLQLETGLGYRTLLHSGDAAVYLVPSLGAVTSYDWMYRTRVSSQLTRSDCSTTDPCDVENATERLDERHRFRLAPTLSLSLHVGPGELSYQVQLGVQDPAHTTHQILLGSQF